MHARISALLFFALLWTGSRVCFASPAATVDAAYRQDYAKWKSELAADLKNKWLPFAGLFWLHEGKNRVGGDHKLEVPLPEGEAPPLFGVIDFHAGKALFTAEIGTHVTSDAKPVTTIELLPDGSKKPTILQIGQIKMLPVQYEQQYGMRILDEHSKALQEFKGLDFFPFSANYVVTAKFIPNDKQKKLAVPDRLGHDAEMDSAGSVEFTVNGQKQRLYAMKLTEGSDELLFIIKDQTAGKATYSAGRLLHTALPKNGQVVLDFNRAYTPPCAWNPYVTCLLPPKENYMQVKIEAGEKFSGHH